MDNWKINDALKAVWIFIRSLNKYIDVTMPWVLAKDEAKRAALDAVLYHLCEGMRFVSLMVEPVIPIAAEKIWAQLGLVNFEKANYKDLVWGGIVDGTKVAKGLPIFPRIEVEKEELKAKMKSEGKLNLKKQKITQVSHLLQLMIFQDGIACCGNTDSRKNRKIRKVD